MADEKPSRASSLSDEAETATEQEKPAIEPDDPEKPSPQIADHRTSQERPDIISDPKDTSADQWTLQGHLRAVADEAQQLGLPPASSKSSVIWKNLTVKGEGAGVTYQESVGQVLRGPLTAVQNIRRRGKTPQRTILHNVQGVLRESQMLLILGRPGAGCSTLLKSLCGLTNEYLGWEGDVRYNGVDVDTFKKRFRGDAVYSAEVDTHFPHLKVGNTLDFASETKVPRIRMPEETKKDFVKSKTDLWTRALGLGHTLKTKVGNDYVRGISGGERKRVSLTEILTTRASVTYWDNPTRGLDSSTSLDFVHVLRNLTNITRNTAIVALYQAGENLTQQFDKVTVLYLGRQIFFGTVPEAKKHFEDLGFYCKPRQTTADFLTAITDPYARRVKQGWEQRAPRSPDEFAQAWKKSPYYAQLEREMQEYEEVYNQPQVQFDEYEAYQLSQKSKYQRKKSIYMVDLWAQCTANMKRSVKRLLGDRAFLTAQGFSALFLALIMGSLFYDLPDTTNGFFSKSGTLFFSVLFYGLQAMAEIGTQYAQRAIVQRQNKYAMYHPFMDSIATMVGEYPLKLVVISCFDLILYFMSNLKLEAGAFFIFWIVTTLTSLSMSVYFRTLAAITRQAEAAMALGGITFLSFAMYIGYVIPKPSMHPWLKWIIYINPMSYPFESLMANEFHNVDAMCTSLVPSGPGYQNVSSSNQVCAVTGARPGQTFVNGDDYLQASYDYSYSHLGRNIGIQVVFLIGFAVLFALSTEYNSMSANQEEFLIFRRGHEPESVRVALQDGKPIEDVESQDDDIEPATQVKTNASSVRGLVKSRDVFTWEGLNYDIVTSDGSHRRLLNGVFGYVKPGTLTALMGESGAGKTTLLNVLAQRVDVGVVSGQIGVNGSSPGRSFQRRTGYVQQQDVHLAESTVREALRFSAALRQPQDAPLEEKYAYVENVIEILEMQDYAEAIVGIPGNGLNVEQRKRTTIGVELVAKPALLLFLDEPTSGLDSQSAWSIVRFLRKLANSGQAILCTIHQPSSVLFEQFDRLLLLQKGGKMVYFGDIGDNSRKVIDYFEGSNAFPCPPDANPAEYILDVIGAGATAHADRDWNEVWMQSRYSKEALEGLKALKEEYSDLAGADQYKSLETEFALSWFSQYRLVQSRLYLHYWRNPSYVVGKLMLNIVAALVIGFTFFKEDTSVIGLQNKVFAIFMSLMLAFPLMNQLQPRFHDLEQLYITREKPSKMYHYTTFVLSALFVEIPYNIFTGTVFFLIWFNTVHFYGDWPSDTNQGARGFYMWLMLMCFEMWFSTFGQAIAALAPDPDTAAALTTLFSAFTVLFSGVLQPFNELITFWHWVYRASPYTYVLGGFITNALHGVSVECDTKEINHFSPPSGQTCVEYAGAFTSNMAGTLLNPNATQDCQYCRYKDSDEFLTYLTISYGDRWRNIGLLFVYIIFNMGLALAFFYVAKVYSWNFGRFKQLKGKTKN